MEKTALKQKKSLELPLYRQYISAILAGMCIALGAYGSVVFSYQFEGYAGKLLGALIFPVGITAVIVFGLFLFTSSNLYVFGTYEKHYGFMKVVKFWGTVWVGNLIGSLTVAVYAFLVNGGNEHFMHAAVKTYLSKVDMGLGKMFLLGIGCNVLVCMAVLMAYQAKDTMGKVIVAAYPVVLFIVLGFQHSVANMFYLPLGMMYEGFDWMSIANLAVVTLGNIVGGVLFGTLVYLYKREKEDFTQESSL